jgi:hypothetical protein
MTTKKSTRKPKLPPGDYVAQTIKVDDKEFIYVVSAVPQLELKYTYDTTPEPAQTTTKERTMPAISWKSAERTMIPEGDYDAIFSEGKVDEANNKKSMNFVTKFIITEPGDFEGRSVIRYFNLTEKALWATMDFFVAMGVDEDDFEETDTDEAFYAEVQRLAEQIAGDPCVITIKHNPDTKGKVDKNGEPVIYANIDKVTAA